MAGKKKSNVPSQSSRQPMANTTASSSSKQPAQSGASVAGAQSGQHGHVRAGSGGQGVNTRSSRKRNASLDPITPERKKTKALAQTPPSLLYGGDAFSDTQANNKGKKIVDEQFKTPLKPVQDRAVPEKLSASASGSSSSSHQLAGSNKRALEQFAHQVSVSEVASPAAQGSGKKRQMFAVNPLGYRIIPQDAQQTPSPPRQGSPSAQRSSPVPIPPVVSSPAPSAARRMYPAGIHPSDEFEEDCFARAVAAKNSDVNGELSDWLLPAVYRAFLNLIDLGNLKNLNPLQYLPASANAQAKSNPLVIGVETPIATPVPEKLIAETVEAEQPALNKGKQPATQDELDEIMRLSNPDQGSDDEGSQSSGHDSDASSVDQVAGGSSDAHFHGAARKAPCFNCMIKISLL
ncbi:hypothetical protein PTMSG1_01319 [Pyrenophora teres f. maculata]|nr:hypothetical protein PTMSG1_01319 [Pyrenophora teres f. maculata]